ncbi:MAG: diguanylate cyclase [Candidatus Eremiobacteraeota bacterium]|nr:diguanylate cyclase [Candidatus Eremiobacteraeota bacterium]
MRFDSIARLAARLFDAPLGLVTLVESDRVRVLGSAGLAARELPREIGLCVTAVSKDGPHVIEDAGHDLRSARHSLVAGPENVRFYAGVVLRAADGTRLGTLCVMDRIARRADPETLVLLEELAALAVDRLELRAATVKSAAAHLRPAPEALDEDALTGLPGRRAFERDLEVIWNTTAPREALGAVAVTYVEGLKAVNGRRGRELGDQLLRAVAGSLLASLPEGIRLYRIGGCEFGMLLDPLAAREADAVKIRVDRAMQTVRFVGFHEAFACVGIGELAEADAPQSAYRLADWRAYGERMQRR